MSSVELISDADKSNAPDIAVSGIGVVSPAGWGMEALRAVLREKKKLPSETLERPGWADPLQVLRVPRPANRPAFLAHARLRRTSPITQYAIAAAMEALGPDAIGSNVKIGRVGVVLCVMSGCVNYSRRFYDETLRNPATASPLVFPETVFNAPASHLAALLGTNEISYTLVGDPGTFLQGLALGATLLSRGELDSCLVVGAEEADWLSSDAYRLFNRKIILAEGAGAVCLRYASGETRASRSASPLTPALSPQRGEGEELLLKAVTASHNYSQGTTRQEACARMRNELLKIGRADLLCDGMQGNEREDRPELIAWKGWSGARISPKRFLGEGLAASAAWQCAAAIDSLLQRQQQSAYVSVAGCNQQAIGAHFGRKELA